jgi:iron(II)-dependent oxidoreductase
MIVLLAAGRLPGQDTQFPPKREQIPGPPIKADQIGHCCWTSEQAGVSLQDFQAWLQDLKHYRHEALIRAGYSDVQYHRPELQWAQSSFIKPQTVMQDRYFYDPVAGRYTVDKYLDDPQKRYSGIDSVLIWHTHPNIGIDNRHQYDWLRDMPGGITWVRRMVDDFHRRTL